MFKYLRKKKGQSIIEYAILIIIVIGALLTIQVYIKRGVQGRLMDATDQISEDQFSPGNTNYISTRHTVSQTQETFNQGKTESKLLADETTDSFDQMNIINIEREFWGKQP